MVQVISRRAPNIQDLLFKRKSLALSSDAEIAGTHKCNTSGCQTCLLVSNASVLHHRNNVYKTCGGNCKSWNLIYGFQCKLCSILYVGKTCDSLKDRVNGHRSKFYGVLKKSVTGESVKVVDDEQILGAHLVHDHGLLNRKDFNISYRIFILARVDPLLLRRTEQL